MFNKENIDGIAVVKISCADTSALSASRFKEYLIEHLNAKEKQMIIDLSESSHIDSSMLGALICISKMAKKFNIELRIVKSKEHGHIWSLFEFRNIYKYLKVYGSLDEAIYSYLGNWVLPNWIGEVEENLPIEKVA
jgi:anti-anti-sigma factor